MSVMGYGATRDGVHQGLLFLLAADARHSELLIP
jgi:hypothetical protein